MCSVGIQENNSLVTKPWPVITSQMGPFSATQIHLKEEPRVQCHYQLVASTSCRQFTADGEDLLIVRL